MFKKKPQAKTEKPVASPCVSICALDENDVCVGCYRSADEIVGWGKMDSDQRLKVLANSEQRGRDAGAYFS